MTPAAAVNADVAYIDESGRFTQTVPQLRHQLAVRRRRCSVYLGSEFDNPHRSAVLASDGWQGAWGDKGGRDDCGGTWDPEVWHKVWAGTVVVSDRTYIDKRGQRTGRTVPFYAALEHKFTGDRWFFGKLHTPNPPESEIRSRHPHTEAGLTYHEVTAGFRDTGVELADKHGCGPMALSADWNLNLREQWAYEWLQGWGAQSDLKMCWRWGHLPAHGTFGRRELIDATLIRGARLIGQPEILRTAAGDDHTGELLHLAAVRKAAA